MVSSDFSSSSLCEAFQWVLNIHDIVTTWRTSVKTEVLLAQEHFQSHYTIHAIVMASMNEAQRKVGGIAHHEFLKSKLGPQIVQISRKTGTIQLELVLNSNSYIEIKKKAQPKG